MEKPSYCISVIGLGYVGLPLAVEFSKYYPVIGFDINQRRIDELHKGIDITLEIDEALLKQVSLSAPPQTNAKGLYCSSNTEDISKCNVYIITVPTPVDKNNRPD